MKDQFSIDGYSLKITHTHCKSCNRKEMALLEGIKEFKRKIHVGRFM